MNAERPVGEIIVTLESDEKHMSFDDFDVTYDSSADEILKAVAPAVLEEFGVNIEEDQGDYLFTVKKVENSGNVFIFPKSPAGLI